jgi:hypothetical protein
MRRLLLFLSFSMEKVVVAVETAEEDPNVEEEEFGGDMTLLRVIDEEAAAEVEVFSNNEEGLLGCRWNPNDDCGGVGSGFCGALSGG